MKHLYSPAPAIAALSLLASLAACATPSDEPEDDGEFDTFAGKTDVFGIDESSYEAAAVLEFANAATRAQLIAAGVGPRAAGNLTGASRPLATLLALDGVAYTGTMFFGALLDHVVDAGLVGSCGDGTVQPLLESCDDASCAPCRGNEDPFSTERLTAKLDIERLGVTQVLALETGEFAIAGAKSGAFQLDTKTLPAVGARAWFALVGTDGDVKTLVWLETRFQINQQNLFESDGTLYLQSWGDPVAESNVIAIDPSTGTTSVPMLVPAKAKLLTWGEWDFLALEHMTGQDLYRKELSLRDRDTSERIWAVVCSDAPVFGHDQVWCDDRGETKRYDIGNDQAVTIDAGAQPQTSDAIRITDDGFILLSEVDNMPTAHFYSADGDFERSVNRGDGEQPHRANLSTNVHGDVVEAIGEPMQALGLETGGWFGAISDLRPEGPRLLGRWPGLHPTLTTVSRTHVAVVAVGGFDHEAHHTQLLIYAR